MPEFSSFDVFDTAITRPWFTPTDMFYAVGVEARQAGLWQQTPAAFRTARIAAEAQARARTAAEDVTLAEVYDALAAAAGWSAQESRAVQDLEREVEYESCVPIARTLRTVADAARDRVPLFISDTYLDADMVGGMLRRCGFPVPPARVFVSSERGRTKWSGHLFIDVLEALQAPPGRLRHAGDNPVSDLRAARRVGIAAELFAHGAATRHEASAAARAPHGPMLASAIAGSARAARLSRHFDDPRQQAIWNTSADVSGPLLTGYVLWLLGRAIAHGRRRLYFFARDGQILKRIAEHFVQWYGLDIEIRYLYVSRRALFLAALDTVDEHALDWFVEDSDGKTLADILARLDLRFTQIAAHVGRPIGPETRLSRDDMKWLVDLLGNPAVTPMILAAAARRRALVVDYLRQEGLLDGTPFAVIDIGWRGRLQRAMHAILELGRAEGSVAERVELVGYYLGMFTSLARMSWGVVETCLPAGRSYCASLLEFFTAADHGSTFGYERIGDAVRPVLDESSKNVMGHQDIVLQQEGIMAFATTLQRALRRPECRPAELGEAVVAAGWAAVERMIHKPSPDEAEVFGGMLHSPDQAHLNAVDIAPRVGPYTLFLAAAGFPGRLRRAGDWPEASVRRSLRGAAVGSLILNSLALRREVGKRVRPLAGRLRPGAARIGASRSTAADTPVGSIPERTTA